jgi:tetratricopeptide (TPR) repeat protein
VSFLSFLDARAKLTYKKTLGGILMKKRGSSGPHKDNIFLFPNVDRRLIEKGLDSLQNKRFSEAIQYLELAKDYNSENVELIIGLIIAYFEAGNLKAAKELARDSLQKGVGDYFQLIDIYIMILLQLNEYEEIVATIQALLDEKELPIEKVDNFTKLLEFSKRKLEYEMIPSIGESMYEETKAIDLFACHSLNEQFLKVASLAEKNVRAYLKEIKFYLESKQGHPFIKTMLIQLLKEQELNEKIQVEKFQRVQEIDPSNLLDIDKSEITCALKQVLKQSIEHDNPILYEHIASIIDRHTFLLYPFERIPSDPYVWCAAYHLIGLEYYGEGVQIEEISTKYNVESSLLQELLTTIRELEEISSPLL